MKRWIVSFELGAGWGISGVVEDCDDVEAAEKKARRWIIKHHGVSFFDAKLFSVYQVTFITRAGSVVVQ